MENKKSPRKSDGRSPFKELYMENQQSEVCDNQNKSVAIEVDSVPKTDVNEDINVNQENIEPKIPKALNPMMSKDPKADVYEVFDVEDMLSKIPVFKVRVTNPMMLEEMKQKNLESSANTSIAIDYSLKKDNVNQENMLPKCPILKAPNPVIIKEEPKLSKSSENTSVSTDDSLQKNDELSDANKFVTEILDDLLDRVFASSPAKNTVPIPKTTEHKTSKTEEVIDFCAMIQKGLDMPDIEESFEFNDSSAASEAPLEDSATRTSETIQK